MEKKSKDLPRLWESLGVSSCAEMEALIERAQDRSQQAPGLILSNDAPLGPFGHWVSTLPPLLLPPSAQAT